MPLAVGKVVGVNKAFLVGRNSGRADWINAVRHLQRVARQHGYACQRHVVNQFEVWLVHDAADSVGPADAKAGCTRFEVSTAAVSRDIRDDRYLTLEVGPSGLTIETDYCASVPCFYSERGGFAASNLEPCVWLASGSTVDDLSAPNAAGFLRFSHLIWDETVWRHMFQVLPDARLQVGPAGEVTGEAYLETVKGGAERAALSDSQVAEELRHLNLELVRNSLGGYSEVVLPLSSGYDSRMILAAAAELPDLKERLRCFTYGVPGSLEVEAARELCRLTGVQWQFVELPCRFLDDRRLARISDVFGASLHMHGMYQLEFFEQVAPLLEDPASAALTSGFMTGVPAGQHNSKLAIRNSSDSLFAAMDRFSQSQVWSDAELQALPIFQGVEYRELSESRFRKAFDRFEGELFQRSVMFDVWTRQRNFISYYPRTLEWCLPVVSPHMNPKYANFFMSLSDRHLNDRRAVELMFERCYPALARVPSNSNGARSLGGGLSLVAFAISKILRMAHLPNPLPSLYQDVPFDFDLTAVAKAGGDAFAPLLSPDSRGWGLATDFGGQRLFQSLYEQALAGDVNAYLKVVPVQAIALATQARERDCEHG